MEAFLQLVAQGSINIKPLITHTFDITEAETAYDIVTGKVQEPHIGILLHYPNNDSKFLHTKIIQHTAAAQQHIEAGFIGAGNFAQSYLIPNVKNFGGGLKVVVTSKGITAQNVAQKFSFGSASSDSKDIIGNKEINTVFIATPHNSHAPYVIEALQAGKNVFVEKPLAMNSDELEDVKACYEQQGGKLMVGFNRRFSPVATALKQNFKGINEPLIMSYRVNAGFIPKDHWTQDEQTGGGRIIGEVCHFIDLMQYFTEALPQTVFAQCIHSANELNKNDDNIVINIQFTDGSVGSIVYVATGDKALPKEKLEIYGGGKIGVINDFRGGEWYSNNKITKLKLEGKGHKQEVHAFLNAIKEGHASPISFESMYATTKATFKIIDSLHTGLPQQV